MNTNNNSQQSNKQTYQDRIVFQPWMGTKNNMMKRNEKILINILTEAIGKYNFMESQGNTKIYIWDELLFPLFQEYNKAEEAKDAGIIYEAFTKMNLIVNPMFKGKYKTVVYHDEIDPNTRRKINFDTTDIGVDILAKTHEGKYHAVSCKYSGKQDKIVSYGAPDRGSHTVSAAGATCDVLSWFTNVQGISEKITNRIYSKSGADLTLKAKEIFFYGHNSLQSLTIEVLRDMLCILEQKDTKEIVKYQPRNSQPDIISSVIQTYEDGFKRTQINASPGAGKSFICMWIHEAMNSPVTAVFVPSIGLIPQMLTDWVKHHNVPFVYRTVCSDKSVESEDIIQDHKDLYQLDSDIISDSKVDDLVEFLKVKTDKRKVIFTTYHSAEILEEALAKSNKQLHLLISDEAHRTTGNIEQDLLAKDYKYYNKVHLDECIPAKYRLYQTGTPKHNTKGVNTRMRNLGKINYTMDNEDIFGPIAYVYNWDQAIAEGQITDYKICLVGTKHSDLATVLTGRAYIDEETTITDYAANMALIKMMQEEGVHHPIVYCNSKKSANAFMQRHKQIMGYMGLDAIPIGFIHSEVNSAARTAMMMDFERADKAILVNVRCLTEGISIDAVDAVMFCDPKNSAVDINQALGRTVRNDKMRPDKIGKIILPIYYDTNETSMESQIKNTAFTNMYEIFSSIGEKDNRLFSYVQELKLKLGKKYASRAPKIKEETDVTEHDFVDLYGLDEYKFMEEIVVEIVDRMYGSWRTKAIQYFKYLNDNDLLAIEDKEHELYYWQSDARKRYKKYLEGDENKPLSKEQVKYLDENKFIYDLLFTKFIQKANTLKALYEKGVHFTKLPKDMIYWSNKKRQQKREGTLPKYQEDFLNSFGFIWNPDKQKRKELIERVVKYQQEGGDYKKVRADLSNLRIVWKKGQLSDTEIQKLESVGFYKDPHVQKWYNKLTSVINFKNTNNFLPRAKGKDVPREERLLYNWVYDQLKKFELGLLNKSQVNEFKKLGLI